MEILDNDKVNMPPPRLCHIVKWPDFDGYGFNLHADKSRAGQYIGKVDTGSPAEKAGLQEYDRIIEVNGVNISNENHKQVVQRIKAIENETRLLVIDAQGDRWYKEHNLVVKSDQDNVIRGTSQKIEEDTTSEKSANSDVPAVNGHSATEADAKSVTSSESGHSESSAQPQPGLESESKPEEKPVNDEPTESPEPAEPVESPENREPVEVLEPAPEPVIEASEETVVESVPEKSQSDSEDDQKSLQDSPEPEINGDSSRNLSRNSSTRSTNSSAPPSTVSPTDLAEDKSPMSITPSPPPSLGTEKQENGDIKSNSEEQTQKSTETKEDKSGLNLNMSVAEMKALLASRKKFDPRKDTIDLKKKHQIIQNM